MNIKAILQAALHVAVAGFAAGVAGVASNASWKQILFAGLASAGTSLLALRVQPK